MRWCLYVIKWYLTFDDVSMFFPWLLSVVWWYLYNKLELSCAKLRPAWASYQLGYAGWGCFFAQLHVLSFRKVLFWSAGRPGGRSGGRPVGRPGGVEKWKVRLSQLPTWSWSWSWLKLSLAKWESKFHGQLLNKRPLFLPRDSIAPLPPKKNSPKQKTGSLKEQ